MAEIIVKLAGVEPGLMMNSLVRYGQEIPTEIKKRGIKNLKAWYDTDPIAAKAWDAEAGLYINTLGQLIIPRDVLWGALVRACSGFKVKVGGRNISANSLFPSIISIEDDAIILVDKDGDPKTSYDRIETKFVRVPPRRGARVPKSWAIVFPWFANLIIKANDAITKDHVDMLKIIMEHAGIYEGIMDGRPNLKRYNYGKWAIEKWETDI